MKSSPINAQFSTIDADTLITLSKPFEKSRLDLRIIRSEAEETGNYHDLLSYLKKLKAVNQDSKFVPTNREDFDNFQKNGASFGLKLTVR